MSAFATEASDPSVTPERLAELTRDHPETHAAAALNPVAYAGLLDWLGILGEPAVEDALRRRDSVLAVRASDPSTPPAELAVLAAAIPVLRSAIADNPSAYPELREWIAAQRTSAPAVNNLPAAVAMAAAPSLVDISAAAAQATATTPRGGVLRSIPLAARIATATVLAIALLTTSGILVIPRAVAAMSASSPVKTPVSTTTDPASTPRVDTPAVAAASARYIPTVLILDASGSMIRDVPGGGSRMDAARSAATTLVQGFGNEATVGITVFGTSTGNEDADRAVGCSDVRRLLPVGKIDKHAFTSAIVGIQESGFTSLGPALTDAAVQLGDAETALIVLVTDGVDSCSPPSACDIAKQIKTDHPGFTIQTVGFEVDADEQAQEDLACIAQAGGGEFVEASNAAQLSARLRALTDPVSTAGTLSARGLDRLQIGMSLEEARAVVGGFTLGKVVVDIHYAECDRGTLLFSKDRLIGIIPKRLVATADGVKIGDSLATAAAIFGPGSSGSDASGAFQSFPTAPGSDTGYAMYSVNPMDTATKIVPDPGPAANWAEGCNHRFLATTGVGHSVSIVLDDAGKVTGFVVNAGSPLAPMLPGDGAAATLDAVRAIYPDARSTSSSDTSYLAVNYLTLTSGSQKIWLVADYIEANNPTTDRVGDVQIGSGPHITEEFCG